ALAGVAFIGVCMGVALSTRLSTSDNAVAPAPAPAPQADLPPPASLAPPTPSVDNTPPAPAPAPIALPTGGGSFAGLVRDLSPAVVHIQVRIAQRNPFFGYENYAEGQGTGFIIAPDGFILTNDHVVGQAQKITVRLADDRVFDGRVIGTDSKTDIA